MPDTKNSTKIEVCGKCIRVILPDKASKYPKLEVWIEVTDGQYANTIPFECGEKKLSKFKEIPSEGDTVRCSGYVGGRPSRDGNRCFLSVNLAFMRIEGGGRADVPSAPTTPVGDAPPPVDDHGDMPF